MITKKEIREVIEQNEMIRMAESHFDEESVERGIDELVDAIYEKINTAG